METIRPSFCHERGISWFVGGEKYLNRKLKHHMTSVIETGFERTE